MPERPNAYRGHRCPREVIAHAVRLYLRSALSFRDVEELLAERGIWVSYVTARRWVTTFGGEYADELRRSEGHRGRTWHLDEMLVRVGGRRHWLWRAVDEHGQALDVLLQERRDLARGCRAARRLTRSATALSIATAADRPGGANVTEPAGHLAERRGGAVRGLAGDTAPLV